MKRRKIYDIEYTLLPSTKRKHTGIIVDRDGTVVVKPKNSMTPEEVDEIVWSKRIWIYSKLSEWKDIHRSAKVKEWFNREKFPFMGSEYFLLIKDGQKENLLFKYGKFFINDRAAKNKESVKNAFIHLYIYKAGIKIKEKVIHYAKEMDLTVGNINIKDMNSGWVVRGNKNSLNFNWRIMLAPSKVIDYLVVYELCRLKYDKKDDAFWNEVGFYIPDYLQWRRWLKINGKTLDIFL